MTASRYASAAERVEDALPARLVWALAKAIATDPITEQEFIQAVIASLEDAWRGPFAGLPEEDWRPELERAQNIVIGGFTKRTLLTPINVVYLLIQDLLDTGAWSYPDGGPFDVAYTALVRRLFSDGEEFGASNAQLIDRCAGTARKHARRARQRLALAGFYSHAAATSNRRSPA